MAVSIKFSHIHTFRRSKDVTLRELKRIKADNSQHNAYPSLLFYFALYSQLPDNRTTDGSTCLLNAYILFLWFYFWISSIYFIALLLNCVFLNHTILWLLCDKWFFCRVIHSLFVRNLGFSIKRSKIILFSMQKFGTNVLVNTMYVYVWISINSFFKWRV